MERKFIKAKRTTCILAVLLILCTVLMWGVGTEWGNVKIERVSIAGNNGTTMKAIQLIPRGVNASNPAPVVLTNHGANNSAYSEIVFGIEWARRGYVVFCCDQPNSGEAPINTSDDTWLMWESWVDYVKSQRYIDGRVIVTGLSKGGMNLVKYLKETDLGEKIDCAINIVGAGGFLKTEAPYHTNLCAVWADADGIDGNSFFGYHDGHDTRLDMVRTITGKDDYEFGQRLGEVSEKTALEFDSVRGVHPICYIFPEIHTALYKFGEECVPTGTMLASNDLIYRGFLFVSWLCCFLLICFGASFTNMLASAPGFSSVMQTKLPDAPVIGAKKRAFRIAFDLVIPFILYPIVASAVSNAKWLNGLFRCTSINPIIGWLFAVAMVGTASILIRSGMLKMERPLTAADFGMGDSDEAGLFNGKRIFNGFVIGTIATIVLFLWVAIVIDITGLNYSANAFAYLTRMNLPRFVRALPYIVVIVPIVLVININVATVRRIHDGENETRNTLRDIIFNVAMAIIPLMIIMFCYYVVGYNRGTGVGLLPGKWQSAINYTFAFPFMMGSSVGISTYLNRKTGNIWSGVFTAAFILGLFTITAPMMAS